MYKKTLDDFCNVEHALAYIDINGHDFIDFNGNNIFNKNHTFEGVVNFLSNGMIDGLTDNQVKDIKFYEMLNVVGRIPKYVRLIGYCRDVDQKERLLNDFFVDWITNESPYDFDLINTYLGLIKEVGVEIKDESLIREVNKLSDADIEYCTIDRLNGLLKLINLTGVDKELIDGLQLYKFLSNFLENDGSVDEFLNVFNHESFKFKKLNEEDSIYVIQNELLRRSSYSSINELFNKGLISFERNEENLQNVFDYVIMFGSNMIRDAIDYLVHAYNYFVDEKDITTPIVKQKLNDCFFGNNFYNVTVDDVVYAFNKFDFLKEGVKKLKSFPNYSDNA